MSFLGLGPITWILLSPFLGALFLLTVRSEEEDRVRFIACWATLIPLLIILWLLGVYLRTGTGYKFVEQFPWIPQFGISYQVGVDGISLALLLLHAICSYTGVLISYRIAKRVKEYYIFYLLLITGVYGVFVSLDLFLFYCFYEMAVIPMYPLIGAWGSSVDYGARRVSRVQRLLGDQYYATMKLTVYLTTGAVIALLGLLALYQATGSHTFSIIQLESQLSQQPLDRGLQIWIFPFVLLGFGFIAPMWPFHSWSPVGHAAAPAPVSMLHAGVLMKLGSYAIIRIAVGLLPEGARFWLPWVAAICMMNIIYGGLVAMAQKDTKFIIGYSSSSHMGYVLLGIACLNVIGLTGAVFLMVAHGIMTALAFALIGHIYDQTHTRMLPEWGGLAKQLPFVGTAFVIMAMASSGVPGFGNFIAEVLVIVGAWEQHRWQAVLAVFGIVITATYMLRMVRDGFFGELPKRWHMLDDAESVFERWPYAVLIGALLFLGCWPKPLLHTIDRTSRAVMERVQPSVTAVAAAADAPRELN